jgi:heme iron utilization protein
MAPPRQRQSRRRDPYPALDAPAAKRLTRGMSGDVGGAGDSARFCRGLLRRSGRAALATTLAGAPYVSLVAVAADLDASVLLLLSDLAQHTRNLKADPRAALLFDGTEGHADPLSGPRLTLLGRAGPADDPAVLARFVRRHPNAAQYAGFGDFRLWRVAAERGHLVAGFGRIEWLDGASLRFADAAALLAAAEADIIAHMNEDHAEALTLYAQLLLGRAGDGWRMTGIDPEGIDLSREHQAERLDFAEPVLTAEAARAALVQLAAQARAAAAGDPAEKGA